jgi:hypothetical protein
MRGRQEERENRDEVLHVGSEARERTRKERTVGLTCREPDL